MVVDDEVNATIMLQRIFEREGYQVERVNDGPTALEAAERLLPDLILLDILMPRMNGFEVLKALRANEATAKIPTILVTANVREPADVALGMNLGADDYLYKPFAPQELVARAQSKMKARQLEDALHRRSRELESLLRVSEVLNQYLDEDALLHHILELAVDLVHADAAAIYQVDDGQTLSLRRVLHHVGTEEDFMPTPEFAKALLQSDTPAIWSPENPLTELFPNAISVSLQHGEAVFGILAVFSQSKAYDQSQLRLLSGMGRQAALSLHNAELYAIQMNYALHLEDMVAARTAELQSAQQMLIRSEKLASIGQLASSIAHEINNPLLPIRLTLESLIEDVRDNAPIDVHGINIIQESVERITRIVHQLLDFTGKRSQGTELLPQDIRQILETIRGLVRKSFEKDGMSLELDIPELPPVYGSKDQLEQVFMNLVINAQAAMNAGGKLKISARVQNGDVVIKFADTGTGIEPENIDKIFDPFFSTKPTGTGLGLFVTYGIVEGHHGKIEVDSKVGKGTTFTIRLPTTQTESMTR
jgi:signal transduction histidine kinase/DNA-binding response OmpR family regulator